MSKVQISVGLNGTGEIIVDGQDIANACRGLSIDSRVNQTPRLTVDLGVYETHLTGEMDVRMPDQVYALLTKAGWTPPPDNGSAIKFS